ncbi:expressed unknown protein [Seminavis robusta]|uniref:Uncharacterized protein n=1 Tax=Seminavis robusta TaxID=568900 RepID=A0A9N8H598_9STRA|nr:expressed unknown protein [Seminavis robusta]|eukprot:Sro81_g043350.1 n/a (320) ;mRNA; r:18284-19243
MDNNNDRPIRPEEEPVAPNGVESQAAAVAQENNRNDAVPNANRRPRPSRTINTRILGPFDTGRMELSKQERQWAQTVKEAIEKDSEITNLSDFWYVQLALIEKGPDIDNVLDRARHLQAFRQEYGITETTSSGCFFVHEFIKLFPGFSLSFSFNYATGRYVAAMDLTKFYTAKLFSTPGAVETWLATNYHSQNALNPDFQAIRHGATLALECDGFDWKKNMNLRFFTTLFQEIGSAYPMKWGSVNFFNSGVFINVLMSMVKRISPPEFHENYEFGLVSEAGRLDNIFFIPSMEAANERILMRITLALQRRYANEASFSL